MTKDLIAFQYLEYLLRTGIFSFLRPQNNQVQILFAYFRFMVVLTDMQMNLFSALKIIRMEWILVKAIVVVL